MYLWWSDALLYKEKTVELDVYGSRVKCDSHLKYTSTPLYVVQKSLLEKILPSAKINQGWRALR